MRYIPDKGHRGKTATPGTRLWLWFIALTLILACVPSIATPVPVPSLEAQAINLFIAQTANAASTQTMAAMPTFTSTATFTLTPRNTNTPEPTVTPIQTFILSSPTPNFKFQYYRVKHDSQLARYDFKSRTAAANWGLHPQTPETVPMFAEAKDTSGSRRTNVSGNWEVYIDALNKNDKEILNYLKRDNSALFNSSGFPQLESLTMGGNIITLDEIQGEWGRVNTLDYSNPSSLANVNYVTRPDLVQKFVVVSWSRATKTTNWLNPPHGATYWPLVSKNPVWIQLNRLERFPRLPMVVTVTATQVVRKTPEVNAALTGSEVAIGESVTVVEYHPSASDVWGRLESGGWIALLLNYQEFTSWHMETVPPPP